MAGPPRSSPARPRRTGHGPLSRHTAVRRGELRLIPALFVALACVVHVSLPSSLLAEPRWVLPSIEVLILVTLTSINPSRLTRETMTSRSVSVLLVVVVIVSNTISLLHLVHDLFTSHGTGRDLLVAAVEVLATNVLAFALIFWELDRGGPVARHQSTSLTDERRVDFLFPQDADPHVAEMTMGTKEVRWIPVFTDYLYLSATNSTAFSPTDTMPLTTRAKALMCIEATVSIVVSLLVVARAVNILA